MNPQFPANRVEMELSQWKAREERFNMLFSITPAENKSLLAEKLRLFEKIRTKYKSSKNIEEQHTLRILKMEIHRMSKQLHPSLISRILRKITTTAQNQLSLRSDAKKHEINFNSINEKVQRIGFPDLSEKIKNLIDKEQENFSVPLSYYINEKEKINHTLCFSKNTEGHFELDGFKSSLQNNSAPEDSREYYFKNGLENNFKLNQVYNLLSGRSVEHNQSWFQLDFNDKDASGNYHLKEFRNEYAYDLEKTLKAFPLKEISSQYEIEKLKNTLRQGDRASAVLIKNGRENQVYIEANPQFKSLNIFNHEFRKVQITSSEKEIKSNSRIQSCKPSIKNQSFKEASKSKLRQ
ncbi:hypothetical protein [Flavobacterium sp. F52]|uniref:hypothetical protein n=1 Tax=Flavobacterium sp. F52 TaxID=1202532 RepID=UPI000272D4F6|nr:hypothetical protein [Flavobacterium sp. F52]EJG03143.1 hypothetical protein FF52_03085 [Flavobacterium sp. F52]